MVDALLWSVGLQNAKPGILSIIPWMLLVHFVILVISAARATLAGASQGADGRAIKPPIVAKRRIGISTDVNKVPTEGVRL